MNDLCISLGDCGGYVNIEGEYTQNFEVDIEKSEADKSGEDFIRRYFSEEEAEEIIGELDYRRENAYSLIWKFASEKYSKFADDNNIGEGDLPEYIKGTAYERIWGGDSPEEFYEGGGIFNLAATVAQVSGVIGGGIFGLAFLTSKVAFLKFLAPIFTNFIVLIIAGIALVVSLILSIFGIGDRITKTVSFECNPWEPPLGGENCYKCNEDENLPCNEYRCESLGTACRILEDVYETENPICVNIVPDDNIPPTIEFSEVSGEEIDFKGNVIDNGVEITLLTGEPIEMFTGLNVSLTARNEAGVSESTTCRYILGERPEGIIETFEGGGWNSELFLEGTSFSGSHTISLTVPSLDNEYVTTTSGTSAMGREGELDMYIACSDIAGNLNTAPYLVRFKIQEIDNTAPRIISSTPTNGSYLAYRQNESIIQLNLNEPSECKWSYERGKAFDEMNNFVFCEDYNQGTIKSSWSCSSNFENLNKEQNNIWIRCKDHPEVCNPTEEDCYYEGTLTEQDRNTNTEDALYTLYQTKEPLEISSVFVTRKETADVKKSKVFLDIETYRPKIIYAGESPAQIELGATTKNGAYNGEAICEYKIGSSGDVFTTKTGGTEHLQSPLFQLEGEKDFTIICTDLAGNTAEERAIFEIQIDENPPGITRVYKSGGSLVINTDEESRCFSHPSTCNFNIDDEEVEDLTTALSKTHRTSWNSEKEYNIRCIDSWGNTVNGCTMRILPVE